MSIILINNILCPRHRSNNILPHYRSLRKYFYNLVEAFEMPDLGKDIREFTKLLDCRAHDLNRLIFLCWHWYGHTILRKRQQGVLQMSDHLMSCFTSYLQKSHHHPIGI